MRIKIVYHGAALAGKTANLQYVYQRTEPALRSAMVSTATDESRVMSFTLKPKTLAEQGVTAVELVTIPGAVLDFPGRKAILADADGVVFVVDSQPERAIANVESLELLDSVYTGPRVIQYNKRDLPNRMRIEDLEEQLNKAAHAAHVEYVEATASKGEGVFDTLKACANRVLLQRAGAKFP